MARIAFITPRFSEHATIGGAETLLKMLAERASSAGHEVSILTTCASNHFSWQNERAPGRERYRSMEVHYFEVDRDRNIEQFLRAQEAISTGSGVSRDDEAAWLDNHVNSAAMYSHLAGCEARYDRIITGPYLLGLTVRASRIHPRKTWLVPCLHDEPFAYLESMRTMFRSVRGLLFNSPPEQCLARRLFGVDDSRSWVVGAGIEQRRGEPYSFRERHGLGTPYVAYCGRREPMKGTGLMLDYLDQFRRRTDIDVKLVMTGSGDFEVPRRLKPHILDLGVVSEEDKYAAMAGAAAFLHPSVNESLSLVTLEALMCGTPVLVNGRSDVLRWHVEESGAGYCFEDYPDFELHLGALLQDHELSRALGEKGRQYVTERYSWDDVDGRLFRALAS